MSKKAGLWFCAWSTLWVAVFFTAYNFVPVQPFGWIMFVVLTLYLVTGFTVKKVGWAALLLAIGLLWGQIYLAFINFFANLGVDYNVSFAIGMLVVTFAILALHTVVLAKTPLSTTPYVFAGVFFTFSQAGSDLGSVCIALVCGLVLSVLVVSLMPWLMKKFPLEEKPKSK